MNWGMEGKALGESKLRCGGKLFRELMREGDKKIWSSVQY
jgi:hypothetical protein